jgi:outer membrane protein OmpA-like peptidoglycan-associated protein
MTNFTPHILTTLIFLSLTACNSMPPKDEAVLKEAREAYAKAQQYANADTQVELAEAKKALEQAENAENEEKMKHFAYLAKQQAGIVIATAERQETEEIERQRQAEAKQRRLAAAATLTVNPQLQQKLSAWENRRTGQLLIQLDEVFETDGVDLSSQALRDLEAIAAFLKNNPYLKVLLEGHASQGGNYQYNQGLAERRAMAVKFALMEQGITSKQILVKNSGENYPFVNNLPTVGYSQAHSIQMIFFTESEYTSPNPISPDYQTPPTY